MQVFLQLRWVHLGGVRDLLFSLDLRDTIFTGDRTTDRRWRYCQKGRLASWTAKGVMMFASCYRVPRGDQNDYIHLTTCDGRHNLPLEEGGGIRTRDDPENIGAMSQNARYQVSLLHYSIRSAALRSSFEMQQGVRSNKKKECRL